YAEIAAEVEQFRALRDSRRRQLKLIVAQQQELKVTSPIGGRVLTWDVAALLKSRPVRRGQLLLTVADLDGPWTIELDIPDRRVGHVLEAQAKSERPLDVRFLLATAPETTYRSHLKDVALSTTTAGPDSPTVRAIVPVRRDQLPRLRPGATVTAKIHCGRRPLGYVWLHELFEWAQSRLLF
ncbi:MAG: HlyD family efflux transporter periplasmic adaptor subunit, partial [Planctomycetaceae bacterium]